MKPASYDVIIVGSGLAAITTALSLPKRLPSFINMQR